MNVVISEMANCFVIISVVFNEHSAFVIISITVIDFGVIANLRSF
jgi:hypothetical protein